MKNVYRKILYLSAAVCVSGVTFIPALHAQTTPTQPIPLCRVKYGNVQQIIPCTGIIPVDKTTGNPISWSEAFSTINLSSASGVEVNSGATSTKAKPVQNTDGTKLASETTINTLFKAGQSIGNTTFASTQSGTWNVGVTALPSLPAGGNTIGIVNITPGTAISNVIQSTTTDRGLIAGTTATQLMAANASRKGYSIQIQSTTASCYINSLTDATTDYRSLKITSGNYFEPDHHVPVSVISIICSEANVPVYAREW